MSPEQNQFPKLREHYRLPTGPRHAGAARCVLNKAVAACVEETVEGLAGVVQHYWSRQLQHDIKCGSSEQCGIRDCTQHDLAEVGTERWQWHRDVECAGRDQGWHARVLQHLHSRVRIFMAASTSAHCFAATAGGAKGGGPCSHCAAGCFNQAEAQRHRLEVTAGRCRRLAAPFSS